ncbi:RNB domain-containing ribonuclease [Streptomyces sp. NPDC005402]|uniref:ribonuclease catalytic domain-containing protein n=1 Tax=Streptomyces sp. NPDC005402 TaxID=3155338 RepID=UPI0033BBB42D
MRRRPLHMSDEALDTLRAALMDLRTELKVPVAFPKRVLNAADKAAAEPNLPDKDARHLPLFTIDPPTSKDLDQAMHLERRPGGGYRVYYAIADVATFVRPGSPLDVEAHDRIETLYFPDLKVPLHPPVLSEGAASLLPNQDRPALLWQHDLDAYGNLTDSSVSRAMVRSRAQLDYAAAQRDIENGTAEESLALLREIGRLREAVEIARGGISVNLPDQEVTLEDGSFRLSYVATLPVEGWNEQVSLMTGMSAAQIMLDTGTGILRTQKEQADQNVVKRLHDIARALGIVWRPGISYATLVRKLDPGRQAHMAFLSEATSTMLKAEYTVFRDNQKPAYTTHAAIAAPYTHCTAPLRRLVDRYTGELCVAACSDKPPPNWVLDALYCIPCDTARSKSGLANRQTVDLAEAVVLMHRVGEVFDGTVIDTDAERGKPHEGKVLLADPAVLAKVESTNGPDLQLGSSVRATLRRANPSTDGDKVLFTVP